MRAIVWLLGILMVVSCQTTPKENCAISKDEMFRIVKKHDSLFSVGVRNKDSVMLTNIYSDSAQYVQPKGRILNGKIEIGKDWGGFVRMKENPIDLILNIKEVRGNREIIYETGQGYTLLADSTKWTFNYVNVWRLQKDGSYKLEIDTYN